MLSHIKPVRKLSYKLAQGLLYHILQYFASASLDVAHKKINSVIRQAEDYKHIVCRKGVIVEENDSRQYQINISGNRFSISSPYGEEHVREVEKFLDQQIAEVTEHTDAFGPTNVALLVALNLADKLLSLKKRVSKYDGIEEELDNLCYKLDEVLTEK